MNNEAMLRLADALEAIEGEAFQMEHWWTPVDENICGAAACVAGWAVLTDPVEGVNFAHRLQRIKNLGHRIDEVQLGYNFADRAARILGLDEGDADILFTDSTAWNQWLGQLEVNDRVDNLSDITAKHAVIVLRGLALDLIQFPSECRLVRCGCMACEGRRA